MPQDDVGKYLGLYRRHRKLVSQGSHKGLVSVTIASWRNCVSVEMVIAIQMYTTAPRKGSGISRSFEEGSMRVLSDAHVRLHRFPCEPS